MSHHSARAVLPRLSHADAAARGVLARQARRLPMGVPGLALALEPLPFNNAVPPPTGDAYRVFRCDNACYAIGGDGDAIDRLLLRGLGAAPALAPDAQLRQALLAHYLDQARQALGAPASASFTSAAMPQGGLDYRYAWRVTEAADGAPARTALQGTLHCNAAAHRQLAALVCSAAEDESDGCNAAALAQLCLPQRFLAGTSVLSQAHLLALRPGDVVLIQQPCIAADVLTIRTGPRLCWRARLCDTQLQVLQGLHLTMSDTFDEPDTLAPPEQDSDTLAPADAAVPQAAGLEAALDAMRIQLSFDLGQRGMSLAELRALAPGDVIELGRPLDRAVTVRAHGQAIASGELVEIDGRLGVAIVAMQDSAGNEHAN